MDKKDIMHIVMTRDEYWQIVKAIDWRQLIKDKVPDPCIEGMQRAKKLLPTVEHMEAFRVHGYDVDDELGTAIEKWEYRNNKQLPVTDDGLFDLKAMIVGLGKDEWERTIKNPKLAWDRANSKSYDTLESYVENFTYCIPYRDDYDPIEKKLERARHSLNHWVECCASLDAPNYAAREVATQIKEVAELEAQLTGVQTTPEKVAELVRQEAIEVRLAEIKALFEQIQKLQQRVTIVAADLTNLCAKS